MTILERAIANCKIVERLTNPRRKSSTFPNDPGTLSHQQMQTAMSVIATWPGYTPTPLLELSEIARLCGVKSVLYKDESKRFDLSSFKALGGAYAVANLVNAFVSDGHQSEDFTVTTATDGNHGRSVAWGAKMAGCQAKIYLHAHVSTSREEAISAFGADVIRVRGNYDDALAACKADADQMGWQIVSDTSWMGYLDVPREVMAGYSVISAEILLQMSHVRPSHAFIPVGVGGLASGIVTPFWHDMGDQMFRVISVESAMAACFLESIRAGSPRLINIQDETLMAGLSCGEISTLAWELLCPTVSDCISISDDAVASLMQLLSSGAAGSSPIEAGECSTAGLAALLAAASDANTKAALALDEESVVLLIGTEGATDPALYTELTDIARLSH